MSLTNFLFRTHLWHKYRPVKTVRAAVSCCLVVMLISPGALAGRFQNLSVSRITIPELDALERDGKVYELREQAQRASEANPQNPAVLGHLARIRDSFGDQAAEVYERWAEALSGTGAPQAARTQALERGVVVALRDGDDDTAARLSARLGPNSPFSRLATPEAVVASAS